MKLTKIFVASIITVLLLPFISCKKKYPEGPRVSIYTPTHRLLGKWKIEQIIQNNIDITSNVLDTFIYSYVSFSEYIQEGYFSNFKLQDVVIVDTSGQNHPDRFTYAWWLDNEETEIYCSIHSFYNYNDTNASRDKFIAPIPTLIANEEQWKILKLKLNNLWLHHTDSLNNTYEVHLKRIKEDE